MGHFFKNIGDLLKSHNTLGFKTDDIRNTVVFYNPEKNIKRTIIENRKICDFPGIANEELIMPYYEEGKTIPPITRFGYSCECYDREKPQFIMYWMIQPDGRYYADDDGFGAENQSEIQLYAFLDDEGRFEGPFRIRRIGSTMFMGTDLEEQRKWELERGAQESNGSNLTSEQMFGNFKNNSVPILLEEMLEHRDEWRPDQSITFNIPGTNFKGSFRVSVTNRYNVSLGLYREFSDRVVTNYIFHGTEEEVADWMQKPESVKAICNTVEHLMERV
ncbi:MAG: hypothetical protein J1F22_00845 [Lachnospiraceae bacterium]|nr:hypothetical protein [Lachnospiraceae bacterium]